MTPTVTESLSRLYRLHAAGIKFGLETERVLLERLGHPEQGLGIIHVAGTNGKGSVCSMLEAVLRRSGLKTGLYTSPHLIRFNERIRINGRCISDETLAALIPRVDEQARDTAARPGGQEVTFFEFTTALAFECFKREHVDIVVLETGMGGRLDATNVITPLVSVITGVSLEHTDYLGKDLSSIAAEKGGIIKPGRPVVIGPMAEEALPVIQRLAQERQARLIQAQDIVAVKRKSQNLDGQQAGIESDNTSYGGLRCPLIGRHQLENMGIAVAALEVLRDECGLSVTPRAVKEGLEMVRWPGRCQVLSKEPVTILDGAHNPEGAHILSQVLHELVKGQPVGLVAGMCADKDLGGFLRALAGRIQRVWAVPLRTERSLPPGTIAAQAQVMGCPVAIASVPDALREASAWAAANRGVVCIAGSLYLAGEVLELRGKTESLFD
ncbi:MAG: bifunctional folylpolyglutamate synthase/dihydrofolate synthase [Kiritimatiellaeota bacterium]|nr:bifunctional folylpolyglutamate synthase/dihydrofolate synthase [Kiritimatiellota bacterium]